MKTRNSLSQKLTLAFAYLLLFLLTNQCIAQTKHISIPEQQKAPENTPQSYTPQCLAPGYIIINSYSSNQLSLRWEDMGNVIEYKVSLHINGLLIGTYTPTRASLFISTPLRDNDRIEVCVRTVCTNNYTSKPFCKLATNLTAVATVDPVYLIDIGGYRTASPCDYDEIGDCSMIDFNDIASRENSEGEETSCAEFWAEYNINGVYRTQDICNPPGDLEFFVDPTLSAEKNCIAFAKFLELLTSPTGGGATLFFSTPDGTSECDPTGKTATNLFESISLTTITPNPAQDHCLMQYELAEKSSVTLSIFDTLGKKVWETKTVQSRGKQSLNIDLSHLPEGILYYTLSTNEIQQQGKFIKVK